MPFVTLFHWLAQSAAGQFMQKSTWAFAVVEMVHLLGLAILGGTILLVDLRLLGWIFREQPVSRLARGVFPMVLGSLLVLLGSGVLLLSEEAMKCYFSEAFRFKMLLLAIVVTFHFTIHRRVVRGEGSARGTKLAAAVSLALWLGVGVAGRAIGFL
jgi:hypothetical protein